MDVAGTHALGAVLQLDQVTRAVTQKAKAAKGRAIRNGGPAHSPALAKIEAALRHTFRDKALLERALTHASALQTGSSADYERLEFLGDRVLGLVVAEMILAAEPDASEGEVALVFNRLVRRDMCAEIARELGLGAGLVLSPGEADSGGREKQTILADACEAVLAALYIDAGFDGARDAIRRLWAPYLTEPPRHTASDPKTALQEWAQGEGLAIPRYREIAREGPDHMPSFTIAVEVEGFAAAEGAGKSKRNGEREAARAFLVRERIWRRTDGGAGSKVQRAR